MIKMSMNLTLQDVLHASTSLVDHATLFYRKKIMQNVVWNPILSCPIDFSIIVPLPLYFFPTSSSSIPVVTSLIKAITGQVARDM